MEAAAFQLIANNAQLPLDTATNRERRHTNATIYPFGAEDPARPSNDVQSAETRPAAPRRSVVLLKAAPLARAEGSKKSLWKSSERIRENTRTVLIHVFPIIPAHSKLKSSWDLFILFFVVYNAISVPLDTGFKLEKPELLGTFESLVDFLFILDIVLSFRTAYVDEHGTMIRDGKKIAKHYLHTWFPIDSIASIPFEYIAIIGGFNTGSQLSILAFLKTPRLLRLGRLLRFFDRMKNAHMFKIVRLMLLMFMISHWIACVWHMLYTFTKKRLKWTLEDWEDASTSVQYLNAYYRSFLMMSGENVDPQNNVERLFCCLVFVLGACFTATIVGNMALLINYMNATAAQHKQRHDMVNDAVRYLGIEASLQKRIEEYFDYLRQYSHPGPQGMKYLSSLPRALFEDVCSSVHYKAMEGLALFEGCDETMITYLATRLRFELYLPGESIFRIGDIGQSLYRIMKGKVAVVNPAGEMISMMREGDSFGEIALFVTTRRTATCIALSHCDLAVLDSSDLQETMREFPESAKRIHEHARYSVQELQCSGAYPEETSTVGGGTLARADSHCVSFVAKPNQRPTTDSEALLKQGSYAFLRVTRSVSSALSEADLLEASTRTQPEVVGRSGSSVANERLHRLLDGMQQQMRFLQAELDTLRGELEGSSQVAPSRTDPDLRL